MKILKYENNDIFPSNSAVALGNFDGLHVGHMVLIEKVIKESNKKQLISSVLLFNNHTRTVTNGMNSGILTSNEQKVKILDEMGMKSIYTMDFNEDVMKMDCEQFVKKILIERMKAKLVVAGFNYHFGYKAKGDSRYLKELGSKNNIEVICIDPIYEKGTLVSSTYIRKLLMKGNIKEANLFLGRPYTIIGHVVKGKGRGKKLGFPTANIKLVTNYLIPKTGVYRTKTYVDGKCYTSITNIGNNPTFNEDSISFETHIIDFNDNIYGKKIRISFLGYIREEKKFEDKDKLTFQVLSDIKKVKGKQI